MKKIITALLLLTLCSQAHAIDRLNIKQGATLPIYRVTVVDTSGATVDLTGCTVTATMRQDGNTTNAFSNVPAVVSVPTAGYFDFYWNTSQTAKVGTYTIQFTIAGPAGTYGLPTGTLAPITIEPSY
jgi:hypothetical protein